MNRELTVKHVGCVRRKRKAQKYKVLSIMSSSDFMFPNVKVTH